MKTTMTTRILSQVSMMYKNCRVLVKLSSIVQVTLTPFTSDFKREKQAEKNGFSIVTTFVTTNVRAYTYDKTRHISSSYCIRREKVKIAHKGIIEKIFKVIKWMKKCDLKTCLDC